LAIITSAAIHMWADYHQHHVLSIIFKPLTMILIISILFTGGIELEGFSFFIFWGLIFSLLGDMMLLKPWYKFELGLAAFLVGHIFYIIAFISYKGMDWNILPLLPLIGFALWLFRMIKPHLGKLLIPVGSYMSVILLMVWQGMGILLSENNTFGLLIGSGAFIFCVSDSILAYQRFMRRFKCGNTLSLLTYYIAQYLISSSTQIAYVY
jgi:uncharacterized membrane protein YhhN